MKIIKYGADWCGPCKQVDKVLEEAGVEYDNINVEENNDIAVAKNIRNIPYIEFYKDGDTEPTATHVGSLSLTDLTNIISSL